MTREEWLTQMVDLLRYEFIRARHAVPPNVQVSIGWTGAGAKTKKGRIVLGECWSPAASTAERHEIFLSPINDDLVSVVATLVHELCHAAVGVDQKHGKVFGRCAKAMGLVGNLKVTSAGPELERLIVRLAEKIGPFPHARMELAALKNGDEEKKQSTRMLKVLCPACGYTVRTTAKWLELGYPTCPCGEVMESPDETGGRDE